MLASVLLAARPADGRSEHAPTPQPSAPAAAGVRRFEPQGSIKAPRQVVARFATTMVRFGDPRAAPAPFAVECSPPGTGRWLDGRTWVLDFHDALAGGIRCRFTLREDLRDLAGRQLEGERVFAFSTGGPAILSEIPSGTRPADRRSGDAPREPGDTSGDEAGNGDSDADDDGLTRIDPDQVFLLTLDAPATPASVAEHAWFEVQGLNERLPAQRVPDDERTTILATLPEWQREGIQLALRAGREFPADAEVKLVWGAGVASPDGVATEQPDELVYRVRAAFRAEVACTRERADAGCVPLTPIRLRWNAPVAWRTVAASALVLPSGERRAPEPPESPEQTVESLRFAPPFPAAATVRIELPPDIKDEIGRPLVNAASFPLPVAVAALPALAKFPSRFGLLEADDTPSLPVTVRNLEPLIEGHGVGIVASPGVARAVRLPVDANGTGAGEMIRWLRRVARARRDRSVFAGKPALPSGVAEKRFSLPAPAAAAGETEVIGVPLAAPGLWIVELQSRRLGQALLDSDAPMYVPAAALVTNLAVHFKRASEGALVWVTTLADGRPAAGVEVAVHDCAGQVLWSGRTDPSGIARPGRLPGDDATPYCPDPPRENDEDWDPFEDYRGNQALTPLGGGLLVTARRGDDFSFVHSAWSDGIEPFRFGVPTGSYEGPYRAHTIVDRALVRAGDTVHMKHVFRREVDAGFALATPAERPSRVSLRHSGSGQRFEIPLDWRDDGSALVDWSVPREAKLGTYEIHLERPASSGPHPTPGVGGLVAPAPDARSREWLAGSVRVEEFRVPLLQASIRLPAAALVNAGTVEADIDVQHLSGGPAAALPITLRARVRPREVEPPRGFEGFTVAAGSVRAGLVRSSEATATGDTTAGDAAGAAPDVVARVAATLGPQGTARIPIDTLPTVKQPSSVVAEVEFRDPNGETQTASASVALWPASVVPAIRSEAVGGPRRVDVRVVALDAERRPTAGVAVEIVTWKRERYSLRQRVVGGFYAYDDVESTRRLRTLCRGRTGADGTLRCRRRVPATGQLIFVATTRDGEGRVAATYDETWVAGADDEWLGGSDSDRVDLIPERPRYEPGETARLRVRTPFRHATALVTVEREGVIDARVIELTSKEATVEVPIDGRFAPNAFVSVFAVRGRLSRAQPTAMLDLGRPAFRMGLARIDVGWRDHQLGVRVTTDRQVVHPRERVTAQVEVKNVDGAALPAGADIAIAVVDEGLLELLPNPSTELLTAMMGERGLRVDTATAQMQVIGKRHFGKKALPQGGGGGRRPTRELFDTLLLWRGSVPLDEQGRARVEIPLNDSLTAFRIVAVATAGSGQFGTGQATIRSTQDLQILAGLPPVVHGGDRIAAGVTVRNAGDTPLEVEVSGEITGPHATSPPLAMAAQRISLGEGAAQGLTWPVRIPDDAGDLRYQFSARAVGPPPGTGATLPADSMAVTQRILAAVPVRVRQATLTRVTGGSGVTMPVAPPIGSLPGRGGIEVTLSPSLSAGLAGVRSWMRDYPYSCLEQRVSRAIALGDATLWNEVVSSLPALADGDGLLRYFPGSGPGSPSLTAYVVTIATAAGLPLPGAISAKLREGLRGAVDGTLSGRKGIDPLDRLAALAALASSGGADPATLANVNFEPEAWPTGALLDWATVIARSPAMPQHHEHWQMVAAAVRARALLSGTRFAFADDEGRRAGGPFASPDANVLRWIDLLAKMGPTATGGASEEDLPLLVRGALARQRDGAWQSTVANAWGAVALTEFGRRFEHAAVTGQTRASLGTATQSVAWTSSPQGATLNLPWPGPAAAGTAAGGGAVLAPVAGELRLAQAGGGEPWALVRALAAVPLTAPIENVWRLHRSVEAVERRRPDRWSVGDLMAVRLEARTTVDPGWTVLDDPIPAGSTILGRGFATEAPASSIPTPAATVADGGGVDAAVPAFVERSQSAYRAYFDSVPAGVATASYVLRLGQAGELHLPPSRVESLYAADEYAELPEQVLEVDP